MLKKLKSSEFCRFIEKAFLKKSYKKNIDAGAFGENAAAIYLKKHGYKIIGRNFSCSFGEIDVIAEKDGVVVFAEVKTRKDSEFSNAFEAVNYYKQQKIIKTATYYAKLHKLVCDMRFDIIEVYYKENNKKYSTYKINHIENAFCGGRGF